MPRQDLRPAFRMPGALRSRCCRVILVVIAGRAGLRRPSNDQRGFAGGQLAIGGARALRLAGRLGLSSTSSIAGSRRTADIWRQTPSAKEAGHLKHPPQKGPTVAQRTVAAADRAFGPRRASRAVAAEPGVVRQSCDQPKCKHSLSQTARWSRGRMPAKTRASAAPSG